MKESDKIELEKSKLDKIHLEKEFVFLGDRKDAVKIDIFKAKITLQEEKLKFENVHWRTQQNEFELKKINRRINQLTDGHPPVNP